MMKPHCDRCQKLIEDGHKTWIDDGMGTWHVNIGGKEAMFCLDCFHSILFSLCMELKPIPEAPPEVVDLGEKFYKSAPEVVESHIDVEIPF